MNKENIKVGDKYHFKENKKWLFEVTEVIGKNLIKLIWLTTKNKGIIITVTHNDLSYYYTKEKNNKVLL